MMWCKVLVGLWPMVSVLETAVLTSGTVDRAGGSRDKNVKVLFGGDEDG